MDLFLSSGEWHVLFLIYGTLVLYSMSTPLFTLLTQDTTARRNHVEWGDIQRALAY